MNKCEHGRRFFGDEPCECTETREYYAGGYGAAWFCEAHAYHAYGCVADQLAAERDHGNALAQMCADERAMRRS